jgi:hypothetical protein
MADDLTFDALRMAHQALRDIKSFCGKNQCGEYGVECPIMMGEWWGEYEDEALAKVEAALSRAEGRS